MKIKEAHNSFLSYGRGERNYARETLVKLADCFRAWILPVLGEIEIENLTRMDIITWIMHRTGLPSACPGQLVHW